MSSRSHSRFKITKDDLKLFAIMCLIALVVGAAIALIDDKSRSALDSFKQTTITEIKHQIDVYKARELEKIKNREN
ncbi:MAG: hypothetical protein JEZ11_10385 [Desulfobacterales bacterium]|nr:hypothetical protein [Desulfobacterales bacterium]